jgi:hypothetical protein
VTNKCNKFFRIEEEPTEIVIHEDPKPTYGVKKKAIAAIKEKVYTENYCGACDENIGHGVAEYRVHILNTHKNYKILTFDCPQCNVIFQEDRFLKRHLSYDHILIPKDQPLFKCFECEIYCQSLDNYRNHARDIHKIKKFYQKNCVSCNSFYVSDDYFKKNAFIDRCHFCQTKYNSDSRRLLILNIKRNKQTTSNGIKCLKCQFLATTDKEFERHFFEQHPNTRFYCKFCNCFSDKKHEHQ